MGWPLSRKLYMNVIFCHGSRLLIRCAPTQAKSTQVNIANPTIQVPTPRHGMQWHSIHERGWRKIEQNNTAVKASAPPRTAATPENVLVNFWMSKLAGFGFVSHSFGNVIDNLLDVAAGTCQIAPWAGQFHPRSRRHPPWLYVMCQHLQSQCSPRYPGSLAGRRDIPVHRHKKEQSKHRKTISAKQKHRHLMCIMCFYPVADRRPTCTLREPVRDGYKLACRFKRNMYQAEIEL